MKFLITRSSQPWFEEDEKPCKEAYIDEYLIIDTRTTDCPTKIPAFSGNPERAKKDWFSSGTNHRIENGQIKRDMKMEKAWFIDINTLTDLITFTKKYGNLVLETAICNENILAIEIYDTYRE